MRSSRALAGLLVSTALGTVLIAPGARAQEAAAAAANARNDENALVLGDVVVTATRQADTVNRVPLSISAVTQKALDQQGIKNVADLQRTVPALNVSGVTAGVATFSIRGIVGTGATSPTTGVYLDDIPLQKRSTQGVSQNNGTPSPPLFDLERIEVLRGPQGTLFGGSSEGGTIRFIQPQPSLTRYSFNARAEVSGTHYGSASYEGGIAVGGPIIQDKLGFRATFFNRHTGGYIDLVDPYTLQVRWKDANSSNNASYRLAIAARPTERLLATLSYYATRTAVADTQDGYLVPLNRQLTEPSYCYNVPAPTSLFTSNTPAPVPCPASARPGQTINGVFMRPSATYGPFNFGPFQNVGQNLKKNPVTTDFAAPNLTLDYDLGSMTVKSITSYIEDRTGSLSYETPQVANITGYTDRSGAFYAPGSTVNFTGATCNPPSAAGCTANVTSGALLFQQDPYYAGAFRSKNRRWGVIQEVRFASAADAKPLSWVGGVYFSNIRGTTYYELSEDIDQIAQKTLGVIDATQRYNERIALNPGQTCASLNLAPGTRSVNVSGACLIGIGDVSGSRFAVRYQNVKDVEVAAFGEANYWITDRLKAIAGVRFSRVSETYLQYNYGAVAGWLTPTVSNGGLTTGQSNESPITPKVGVQYQVTDNDLVYVNAAKGYRSGGVNVPLPEAICGPGLALIGLTVRDEPATFGSDTVWSYEAGGKFRIGNRLQVNASAFRIDWSNVQLAVTIPSCGPNFIQNAGTARSEGFDLQAQGRLFGGLTMNFAMGYTNARYTATATGPKPANGGAATPVVNKGDKFAVPPWQTSLGLQYDMTLSARVKAYARGDWQHASAYFGGFGPGVNSYSPDTRNRPATDQVNARIGFDMGGLDINAFVNNLFDSKDPLSIAGGRSGCTPNTDAACGTFATYNPFTTITTFRPRTAGLQVNYRY